MTSQQQHPLVSIITVNFNQADVTRDLLRSLQSITYPNVEVFVVDNGSSSDDADRLPQEFPNIQYIKTGKNLGFAGGNNVAIEKAKGDFILLINNDVEVVPGFLEPLVQVFRDHPKAGFVSPKIVYHNSGERIQYAGSSRINPFTVRGIRTGYMLHDDGAFDHIVKTELGHGACLLVSRDVIHSIGALPEFYFLYFEEHDWTERGKEKGFEVYYAGTSKVYHKESVSTGKNSPLKTYYLARNRILFMKRNTTGFVRVIAFIYMMLVAVPKNALQLLLKSEFENFKAYLRGVSWHFRKTTA